MFSIIVSLAIGTWLFSLGAAADTISIRADEWCPYNCKPGDPHPGFMIEVATKIFAAKGHKVDYQTLSWARAIQETREGKVNAVVGGLKSDTPDFVFPENQLGISQDGFIVKKGSTWRWSGIESLNGITLGGVNDYAYGEPVGSYMTTNMKNLAKVSLISGEDCLKRNLGMMIKGRLGVVIDAVWVIDFFLSKHPNLAKDVVRAGELKPNPVYIAFSPKNPKSKDYAKILSDGVVALRKTGELKTILGFYGLTDWK
jgi:polar amino acid transport system substrate-binding protein